MLLSVRDLTVQYKNGYKGIKDINFDIEHGIYGLLGENGAGKTTLIRVLTTIIRPITGNISFNNILYTENNYLEIQKQIGYLPQELNIYPSLTVFDSLMYLGKLSGLDQKIYKDRVDYYLQRTGLIEHKYKKNKQLSGGMRRRVGLVQALLTEPKLLIVDEPTTGLDPEERVRIRKLLVDFSKERAVLFSTHVIEDLAATTDKIIILKKGELVYSGGSSKLISNVQGRLWSYTTKSETEVNEIEGKYKITGKQFVEDGIRYKILHETKPMKDTQQIEATLEDAYIYIYGIKNFMFS